MTSELIIVTLDNSVGEPVVKRANSRYQEEVKKTRVRRTPEEARAHILAAAERVFAVHLPDVVGLKEVAREAEVSHALITHYFGTYERLVEATLERQVDAVRAELVGLVGALVTEKADIRSILFAYRTALAKAVSNPATVRLAAWAMVSGRAVADDFFPNRVQGLRLLADVMEARSNVPREDLEFLIMTSFSLAILSSFGRRAFAASLGRKKPSREDDAAFERRIDEMIEAFLDRRAAAGA